MPLEPDQREELPTSVPVELLVGGGGALVSLLGIGWLLRQGDESSPDQPTPTGAVESTAPSPTANTDVLEEASSLLQAGESEAAVRALYGTVRQRLGTDGERSATHWEFFTAVTDRVDDETADLVERLTQEYERVVYSPEAVNSETVAELLEEAERVVEDGDSEVAD